MCLSNVEFPDPLPARTQVLPVWSISTNAQLFFHRLQVQSTMWLHFCCAHRSIAMVHKNEEKGKAWWYVRSEPCKYSSSQTVVWQMSDTFQWGKSLCAYLSFFSDYCYLCVEHCLPLRWQHYISKSNGKISGRVPHTALGADGSLRKMAATFDSRDRKFSAISFP